MARKKEDDNQSKQRLLDAAVKIFAIHGFEGASTRQIAKEANVNISAILYYFEGKEGLYHAAMEHLANLMKVGVADRGKLVAEALTNPELTEEACKNLLHQFLRGAMQFMLSDKVSPYAVRIFMREQAEPTPVFEIFYSIMKPVQQTLRLLIGKLTGLAPESEQLALCVHSVLGQIIVFRTHREVVLRSTGWKKFDDATIAKIADTVLPQTDAIIAYYRKGGAL
jgi:AcrR family transcriptional regulator